MAEQGKVTWLLENERVPLEYVQKENGKEEVVVQSGKGVVIEPKQAFGQ
jgi:hypothetical protein